MSCLYAETDHFDGAQYNDNIANGLYKNLVFWLTEYVSISSWFPGQYFLFSVFLYFPLGIRQ